MYYYCVPTNLHHILTLSETRKYHVQFTIGTVHNNIIGRYLLLNANKFNSYLPCVLRTIYFIISPFFSYVLPDNSDHRYYLFIQIPIPLIITTTLYLPIRSFHLNVLLFIHVYISCVRARTVELACTDFPVYS